VSTINSDLTAPTTWWRPAPAQAAAAEPSGAVAAAAAGSPVAFRALVAFTAILLLSPQIWFPALGVLRIAFLAAGIAIAAHLFDRLVRARDVPPVPNEVVIACVLVAWAVMTLPLSYWPAGSVEVLADHYIKAIAFFWLLGSVVNSTDRMKAIAWTFVLCSIPLAFTGLKNYLGGKVLYTGVEGFTRIYGYAGGSGLTGNPNDLALMLNLIIPIAGALAWSTTKMGPRLVALLALVLSVAAVVVTFSRAGFLTLAATGLMFMLVLARRRQIGAAAGLLMIGLAALPLLPEGYTDRLSTITAIESDKTGSARGRWDDTKIAVGVMAANAVVGVGIGQDILAMNQERGATWRQIHNAYLQYGVDLGVLGLALFLWLYFRCYRSARAVERQAAADPAKRPLMHLAAGVQVSLVAFGVAAFFHPIAYQFYFFAIAGLAVALKNTWRTELPSV
jgi:probable O-glycosylation ligase (exosortase A-associated)